MKHVFFALATSFVITFTANAQTTTTTAATQKNDDKKELRQDVRNEKTDRRRKRHNAKSKEAGTDVNKADAAKQTKEIKADNQAVKHGEIPLRKDGVKHPYRATNRHIQKHH